MGFGQVYNPGGTVTDSISAFTGDKIFIKDPIGIMTDAIEANVLMMKIGDTTLTDTHNVVGIAKKYNFNSAENYNGLIIELYGTANENTSNRSARALKSVAKVNPNGFELTNSGGSALGLEGVSRVFGDNGGSVEVATGMYTRILNDATPGPNAPVIENAVSVFANSPVGNNGLIERAVGLYVRDQSLNISPASSSADIYMGYDGRFEFTGNWGMLNVSPFPNYMKSKTGIGIEPTGTSNLQVKGSINISPTDVDTLGTEAGNIAFDSTENVLKYYTGSKWVSNPGKITSRDARFDFPGSDGSPSYMPAPNDPYFNSAVMGIFSQDWPGFNYGSILQVKGYTENYPAWQLMGSGNGNPENDWYLRTGIGNEWNPAVRIWHSGDFSQTDIDNWNNAPLLHEQTITATELLNIGTTAVELIPSAGNNKIIIVERVVAKMEAQTTAYDFTNELQMTYDTYSDAIATFNNTFANSILNSYYSADGESVPAHTNAGVFLESVSDPTQGDGILHLKIYYRIVEF